MGKRGKIDLFTIYRFMYVDKKTRAKFEIFARSVDFADKLIDRVNKITFYNLKRKKLFFCKKMMTELAPYEIELEQENNVREWEEQARNGKKEK